MNNIFIGTSVLVILFLSTCTTGDEIVVDFIDKEEDVYFTDTVTVVTSTVLMDSLVTSGTGTMLVGQYLDQELGLVTTKSYFQIGVGASSLFSNLSGLEENSYFDSLALVLHYNRYSYGDTLQPFTLKVHQVSESFEPSDDANFYNSQELVFNPTPLALVTFNPRPHQQDSLVLRLPDHLGGQFFELALEDASQINNNTDFLEYFKGLALTPGDTDDGAVIGFVASGTQAYLKLYYHQIDENLEHKEYVFPLTNEANQFNQIQSDRTNTSLIELTTQIEELNARETGEISFLQAGVGLITKIEFPYLEDLRKTEGFFILSAELEIKPVQTFNGGQFPLPERLVLYQTNQYNLIGDPLLGDFSADIQFAILNSDDEFGQETSYQFSLLEYLENEIISEDPSDGLLLLPAEDFASSVTRLYLGGNRNKNYTTRLKINFLLTK